MRRFRLLAGCLAVWLAIMPVGTVVGQQVSPPLTGIIGPAGTIWYSAASQVLSNSTTATWLFSGTIPGGMFATQASTNFPSTLLGQGNSSVPLHLILEGLLDTVATPGTINLSVNFGVGTTTNPSGCTAGSGANSCWFATAALANAYTPAGSIVAQPARIDVRLSPIATGAQTNPTAGAATPNITNTVVLTARLELIGGVAASGGITNTGLLNSVLGVSTIAQVNIASAHILNVVWQFGTAGNTLRIYRVILRQAE